MHDGLTCFKTSKITALPDMDQQGLLLGACVGIIKASAASAAGEEAGQPRPPDTKVLMCFRKRGDATFSL